MTAPTRPRRGRAAPPPKGKQSPDRRRTPATNVSPRQSLRRAAGPQPLPGRAPRPPAGDPRKRVVALCSSRDCLRRHRRGWRRPGVEATVRRLWRVAAGADRHLPAARGAIATAAAASSPSPSGSRRCGQSSSSPTPRRRGALAPILGKEPARSRTTHARRVVRLPPARCPRRSRPRSSAAPRRRLPPHRRRAGAIPPLRPLAQSVLGHVGATPGALGARDALRGPARGKPGRLVVERDRRGCASLAACASTSVGAWRRHRADPRSRPSVRTESLLAQIVKASAKGGCHRHGVDDRRGLAMPTWSQATTAVLGGLDREPGVASVFEPGSVNR